MTDNSAARFNPRFAPTRTLHLLRIRFILRLSKDASHPLAIRTRLALTALTAATALALVSALPGIDGPAALASPGNEFPTCAPGVEFLGFSDELDKASFEGVDLAGLSAIAYDQHSDQYYIQADRGLVPSYFITADIDIGPEGLETVSPQTLTNLATQDGTAFTGDNFDGEGIALGKDGDVWVSSEGGNDPSLLPEPAIRRFSALGGAWEGGGGVLEEELPVPDHFIVDSGGGQPNQTFESLSLTPDGHDLFTANEGNLLEDGQTDDFADRIRILRYSDRGSGSLVPVDEYFYLTEPGRTDSDVGVVEIIALSRDDLLVMERGFVFGEGNTVRVFHVSLKHADDVSDEPTLNAEGLDPVEKTLLFDLADCPPSGATNPGTQPNPLLDNFEGMTLSPKLPGGRQALILLSDDNANPEQVGRIVALVVDRRLLH